MSMDSPGDTLELSVPCPHLAQSYNPLCQAACKRLQKSMNATLLQASNSSTSPFLTANNLELQTVLKTNVAAPSMSICLEQQMTIMVMILAL
jgi:hypothetical protein